MTVWRGPKPNVTNICGKARPASVNFWSICGVGVGRRTVGAPTLCRRNSHGAILCALQGICYDYAQALAWSMALCGMRPKDCQANARTLRASGQHPCHCALQALAALATRGTPIAMLPLGEDMRRMLEKARQTAIRGLIACARWARQLLLSLSQIVRRPQKKT